MDRIFVSYPVSDNPIKRKEENRALIERLQKENPDVLFISPLLLFDMEDDEKRDEIMEVCKEIILNSCDEVWSFGDSEGCRCEREFAEMYGVPLKIKKEK